MSESGYVTRAEFSELRREVHDMKEGQASMATAVESLVNDIYNHGRDGIKTQLTAFFAAYKADKENEAKAKEGADEARAAETAAATRRENRRFAILGIIVALLVALLETHPWR